MRFYFDIEYGGNKKDCAERMNCRPTDGTLVDAANNSCIIASNIDGTICPFLVPPDEGMQNGEHLFPVDVLVLLARRYSRRENVTVVMPTDTFEAVGVSADVEDDPSELNEGNC
jgi:hypothetical protein